MDNYEELFDPPDGILYKRGISREVAAGRFVRYTHENCKDHRGQWKNWPCVVAAFAVGELTFGSLPEYMQSAIAGKLKQSDGILMIRNGVDPTMPGVLPEIRPDAEVLTGKTTGHQHGPSILKRTAKRFGPDNGWQRHINKGADIGPSAAWQFFTALLKVKYPRTWQQRFFTKSGHDILWRHAGQNHDGWHMHRRTARYLFNEKPREPQPWSHVHELDFTAAAYRGSKYLATKAERTHLLSGAHSDIKRVPTSKLPKAIKADVLTGMEYQRIREPEGVKLPSDREERREAVAQHWRTQQHEHTAYMKDTRPTAERLSMAPAAFERLKSGDVDEVWIEIESCLKEAAIATAIEAEGLNAVAASYPSVTLVPPEIDTWAEKYLRGKLVRIVPDNDGYENQAVRMAAFTVRERIRPAVGEGNADYVQIVSPPILKDRRGKPVRDSAGKIVKLGADDALAPARYITQNGTRVWKPQYTLADFTVWEREPLPADVFVKLRRERMKAAGRRARSDGDASQEAVLRWLTVFSDDSGRSEVMNRTIARYAFAAEYEEAEAKDLEGGRDPETNRTEMMHRNTLRDRVRDSIATLEKLGFVKTVGETMLFDDDGIEAQTDKGQPITANVRVIEPDIWKLIHSHRVSIGDLTEGSTATETNGKYDGYDRIYVGDRMTAERYRNRPVKVLIRPPKGAAVRNALVEFEDGERVCVPTYAGGGLGATLRLREKYETEMAAAV